VRWRMLDRTAQAIKERNQDVSVEMVAAMVDEAARDVCAKMRNSTL
jgi:hypothetical protein